MQTVLGLLLSGPSLPQASQERHIELPDGDYLVLQDHQPPRWRPGLPVAVLVHGLGGDHRSVYVRRLGRRLLRRHWRLVRLDLRGCGRGIHLARKPYHAGCSDDVRLALERVHSWAPTSPLVLVGFSLGGNIVLKLAGEAHARQVPGLARVAAVNPPIDLRRASEQISVRPFYERHFVRELVALVRRRARHFPDHQTRFPAALTIKQFDDLYIAPRCGFVDAYDYYTRSSALPLIGQIEVPTLILTARDDPLIPVETFLELKPPAHVAVRIASGGGHLGFLGWDSAGGIHWADEQLLDWLTSVSS